jgi:hypothetical protein
MVIIFLDIDGVLRTHGSDLWWSNELGKDIPPFHKRLFSKDAVENLNYIVALTGAKVVITSTWRIYYTLDELINVFRERGFNGKIIGTTEILENRGDEIIDWLNNHKIDNYVVIDDNISDVISKIPECKIAKCQSNLGLNDKIFERVLDIIG